MNRRYLLTALGGAGLTVIAGCSGDDPPAADGGGTPTRTPEPTQSPEPTATPTDRPTSTPYPEADPIVFEGTGQTATDYFSPQLPGPTVIATGNQGSGNFSVWLVDDGGNQVDLVANEIGGYASVDMYSLDQSAQYGFDVEGGEWTVEVRFMPLYERGETPAGSYGRDYASFVGPLEFEGGERVSLSAESDGNVAVWLKDVTGADAALLFNEIGPVNGASTRISVSGTGYIDVRTTGVWSMEIE